MTFDIVEKKCSVCGHQFECQELSSFSFFSSQDLDLRRHNVPLHILVDECPQCGYVSSNIEKKEDLDPQILTDPKYTTCDGCNSSHALTRSFYKRYLLDKHMKKHEDALQSIMRAIWASEDNSRGTSESLRLLALSELDYLTMYEDPTNENYHLIRADILRRICCFELVLIQFDERELQSEEAKKIILFQKHLSKNCDFKRHTISEALAFHS